MKSNKKVLKREDMARYGEFVCSTFQWLPIEEQKKKVKKMANMTKCNKD